MVVHFMERTVLVDGPEEWQQRRVLVRARRRRTGRGSRDGWGSVLHDRWPGAGSGGRRHGVGVLMVLALAVAAVIALSRSRWRMRRQSAILFARSRRNRFTGVL